MRFTRRTVILGMLALLGASRRAVGVEFTAANSNPVGTNPSGVVVADFNGDGKPDLAVANAGSNNVSILLGDGDGSFQAARNFPAGSNPYLLAVGDFNGDGKLDLAVFLAGISNNAAAGEIRILVGNGDGTFQAPLVTTLTNEVVAFEVGDFNGDKRADIVVGNFDASTGTTSLQLFVGKGDGTFQASKAIPVNGLASAQVAVADFNKDGKQDLAVNGPNGIVILEGQGDGTFLANTISIPLSLGTAVHLWTADLNNDGNVDLIVNSTKTGCSTGIIHICTTTQNVGVLLGDGKGSFTAEQVFATGKSLYGSAIISSLSIGDFNGDGKLDVVYRRLGADPAMQVQLGKGDGTFAPPIVFSDQGPIGAAADLDGDKLPDVITLDPANGDANVLLNDSPASGGDLGIVASAASPEPVGVAQNLTYSGDILNEGPQDATGVTFRDTLPAGVTFVSATASQGSCSQSGQVVSCAIDGLPDASDVQVTIIVIPTASGTATNTMNVSGTEPDLALPNNSASQSSTVVPVYTLTVTESGNAPGSVTTSNVSPKNSGDGSIDCGTTCSAKFLSGTQVTLNAGVDLGDFFTGWGGACAGNDSCTVTMSGDQTVAANFVKGNILSVKLAGSGVGIVEDQNAAIFICTSTNGDCSPSLLPGSTISIQAIPSGNSVFGGWSGACSGTDPNVCSVTMNADETLTATFNPPPDFQVTPALASLTVKGGSKVSEVLSFAAQGGFSAAIALTCSVTGTAPAPTCGISPNSVNPGSNATLTVDASGVAATSFPTMPFRMPNLPPDIYPIGLTLTVLAFLLTAALCPQRRRSWLLASTALLLCIFPAACGSSSSMPPPPPVKSYSVTVTASSGAIQHSIVINVTVN